MEEIPSDWPNRDVSEFVTSGTITWHIQRKGVGPTVLFLHGAGSSTHSWAPVIEELKDKAQCIAVDLPGHGFTSGAMDFQLGLSGAAEALHLLLKVLDVTPSVIVGHSAGAAIAVALASKRNHLPIVAINGAFVAFDGLAGFLFPLIAKSMVGLPWIRDWVTIPLAQSSDIKRLIDSTGTFHGEDGLNRYRFLLTRKEHITGTLGMMSQWDLSRDMPRGTNIQSHIHFVQAQDDGTVDVTETEAFRKSVLDAEETLFETGGHLIHEINASDVADIIERYF